MIRHRHSWSARTSRGELRRLLVVWVALVGLLVATPSHAQSPATPNADVRVLWSDGGELLLAGGRSSIGIYGRAGSRDAVEPVEIEQFVDAAGSRAADTFAVFAAADGRLAVWRRGQLSYEQVPVLDGDELVAVAVDVSGTIYAIGRERALYELDRRWRIYPFPVNMRPLAATASPGGQVYIVGSDGLLVRFLDGEWDRPLIPGLKPTSIRAPWHDAWYSAVTQTLWVRVGRDHLVELAFADQRQIVVDAPPAAAGQDPPPVQAPQEPQQPSQQPDASPDAPPPGPPLREASLRVSGAVPAREHPIPLGPPVEGEQPAGFTAITGVASAAGDRVVATAGDRLWLWERNRFVLIEEDLSQVHDLVLDEGRDAAWIATATGLSNVPLVALSEGAPVPHNPDEDKLLARLRRHDLVRQRQSSGPRFFWMPTVRVDNGVVFPLGATGPVAGYSLEIGVGAMLQPLRRERGPTLWVWPEAAYRFETHPTRGGHLFDIGVGVGFGGHLVNAFYRPRLVLGGLERASNDGSAVYGIRNGLAVEALWGIVGLEFSHQFLGSNQGALNDLRLGLSINLAPLIWAGILWATIPTGDG